MPDFKETRFARKGERMNLPFAIVVPKITAQ